MAEDPKKKRKDVGQPKTQLSQVDRGLKVGGGPGFLGLPEEAIGTGLSLTNSLFNSARNSIQGQSGSRRAPVSATPASRPTSPVPLAPAAAVQPQTGSQPSTVGGRSTGSTRRSASSLRAAAPTQQRTRATPENSNTDPTQDILDRFVDAIAYDKWAAGPNDSPLRSIKTSAYTRGMASDPTRSGRMSDALASRMPQPSVGGDQESTGIGPNLSGVLNSSNVRRIGSNLFDAASSVFSAMQAGRTRIPTYEPPQSYRDYQSRITAASNVGLTAAEQSSMQNMIDRNVATGLDSISRFAGASGSSGAALGAIGRVATGANNAMATMAMQDQSLTNQNLSRLGQFEMNNRNFDFNQVFTPFRDQRISDRNQLLAASLMNRRQITDRNDYYRTYEDPNSPYQRMEQAKLGTQDAIMRSIDNLENAPLNFGQQYGMTSTFDDTKLDVERTRTTSDIFQDIVFGRRNNTRRSQTKAVSSLSR